MSTADPVALALLLRQVRTLLANQHALGLRAYPATTELRHFVAGTNTLVPLPRKTLPSIHQPPQSGAVPAKTLSQSAQQQEPFAVADYTDFAEQVTRCRRCGPNALPRLGLGNSGVQLAIIGDCCLEANPSQETIWGKDEDAMLWRMMTAIGLRPKDVYVTNVVKCCQKNTLQLGSEAERLCHSWLEQELQLVQPKIICAMGELPAHVLLNTKQATPLLRLRGKFWPCSVPGLTALVRTTYHPRFLLQMPTMKQATWEDLQAIQKRLHDL
jgi:uracil-DNA glycosylase family 4